MKFIKLEIRNVASIESAEIDFSSESLSASRLFLINGPTGAGKSTILEAICLALFRTAPRLEGLGNRIANDTVAGDDVLKLSSPLSLVRRGAVESSVVLTFDGNDERRYKAIWSVNFYVKGSKKGRIQSDSHTLVDVETGETTRNYTETKNKIESLAVVGTDFDRFCRTTMLAQGSFTRFLSADNKEKADILKDIVGLDVFTRIGAKIAELSKINNDRYKIAAAALNGIEFLDEEMRRKFEEELEVQYKRLEDNRKAHDKAIKISDYMKAVASIVAELEIAEKHELDMLSDYASNDYSDAYRLTERWKATRTLHNVVNAIAEHKKGIEQVNEARRSLSVRYASILRGIDTLKNNLEQIRGNISENRLSLDALKQYMPVIENASVIRENASEWEKNEKNILVFQTNCERLLKEITSVSNLISEENSKEADILKRQSDLQLDLDEAVGRFNEQEYELLHKDVGEKRKRRDALTACIENASKYESFFSDIEEKETEVNRLKSIEIPELQKIYTKACSEYMEKEKAYSDFEPKLNAARLSIGDVAKGLRHGLTKGDICPVCGASIDIIDTDEVFEEAFKPHQQHLESLKRDRDEKMKVKNSLETELKSNEKQLIAGENYLLKKKQEFEEVIRKLTPMIMTLGLELKKGISVKLKKEYSELVSIIAELERSLKAVEDNRKKIIGLNEKLNNIIEEHRKCDKKISLLKERQSVAETALKAEKEKIVSAQKENERMLEGVRKDMPSDFAGASFGSIVNFVNKKVDEFNSLSERKIKLDSELQQSVNLLNTVENISERIMLTCDEVLECVATPVETLESNSVDLLNSYSKNEEILRRTTFELLNLKTQEKEFYELNKDETPESINALFENYDDRSIDMILSDLERRKSAYINARALAENTNNRWKNLIANAPDGIDAIDLECLADEITALDEKIASGNQKIGEIKNRLDFDDANKKKFEAEKKRVDNLERISAQWKEVSDEFGNDRFNKIACAYVLSGLLDNANFYLPMFTKRYMLAPQPDSLEIKLYDNESGYSRAFNTLSGGESFMVSLALALALSSVQNVRFAPDTLFIDEGFGTLSADCLDSVMRTLEQLQNIEGRRVGIISHVETLRDRIPVQIVVRPNGSRSDVEVIG